MKVGYTATEAYHMFRSLRREVFNYFSYEHNLSFGVRPRSLGIFNYGAIAHCDFSDDPETPWVPGDRINVVATGIRLDAHYLPYLYEDELICIFLHELCHATAGFTAQHGAFWQHHARQVGAIPDSQILLRNWQSQVEPGSFSYYSTESQYKRHGATMDQWKDRTLL